MHNVNGKKHAVGVIIKYASKLITQAAKINVIHWIISVYVAHL